MKNSVAPEKKIQNELFDETLLKEPLKILQSVSSSTFSADVIILGLKIKNLKIFYEV